LLDPPAIRETLAVLYRIPLVFSPQPEGGFTVTSPVLPELVTEGDTLEEAYSEVSDALAAVVELYSEQGRPLPTDCLPQ
jgi:antitoxin HicB